jgi:BirA family transcriptional regulator, biotin operon repressor / biotin---[acetyl-CoA-carboxylase] ligase
MHSRADQQLLRHLFSSSPAAIPVATLAQLSGLEEKALLCRIQELRRIGYDIEHHPHSGYSLREASDIPDILIADELQARLPSHPLTRNIMVFTETRSTNDLAQRHGREKHPGPLLILAESQTHGRGRQGRNWDSSPRLGLWFSLLLRPRIPLPQTQRLTIQACLALHHALRQQAHIHAEIKWPNDLLYKGKKLAGILTEAHVEGQSLSYAIIGIGCNINHQVEDFPQELQSTATSLALITGRKSRRADLLLAFLSHFQNVMEHDWESVREEWKATCLNMGRSIILQNGNQTIPGQMIDINDDGALIFRHTNGTLATIHTGEIINPACHETP